MKTSTSWTPGQSGNPGGRPKGAERIAREVADGREYTDATGKTHTGLAALVACLLDIAYDPEQPGRERIAAANSAADRGWGKPKQAIEVSEGAPAVPAIDPSTMTDEQIAAGLDAIATLRRLGAAAAVDDDAPTEH